MTRRTSEATMRARLVAVSGLGALMAVCMLGTTARPALATSTFVVNKIGNASDNNLADARCDTSPTSGKQCTLRAAIQEANDTAGVDTISFNITSTSKVIAPASPLPPITDQTTIDGYTQPGAHPNTLATGNDAVLKIVLDGINAGSGANGLEVAGYKSVVRGLVIQRFDGNGVLLTATKAGVRGNLIGTTAAGTAARANGVGVTVTGNQNGIGGALPGDRNLISGNLGDGVAIQGAGASSNSVVGNYIGTSKGGTTALHNGGNGVDVIDASFNNIGVASANAGNLISGNSGNGIRVFKDSGASTTVIAGNLIGTDAAGTADLGNAQSGVLTDALDVRIGGTTAAARNVISGNGDAGITLDGSDDNIIQGNRIGTKADGTGSLGNEDGIVIRNAADNNAIGGTATGAGNVIASSQFDGILLTSGNANLIQANVIRNNTFHGILAGDGINAIGGGNVIYGNGEDGIEVASSATGVRITANQIFGNGALGIDLHGGTENTAKVTSNDTDDPDSGANGLQNYPVLSSAIRTTNGVTTISGSLNSLPSANFSIELFLAVADASGYGEGQVLLATQAISTNSGGDKSFTFQLANLSPGMKLTATASTAAIYGNSSEFSNNVMVVAVP